MDKIIITHAAESAHFYDAATGEPRYTVIGKNGKERASNVKDARENNWVPSVTEILKVASRPGLEKWIQTQVLLAALTLPRNEGEEERDWIERVMLDSREQGKKAAELGTAIHASVQSYYEYQPYPEEHNVYVKATALAINGKYPSCTWIDWLCEKSFSHPLGFGGKCDLYSLSGVVIDFKTKSFDEAQAKKGLSYEEHKMQLAAYRIGLGLENAICANVFISTSVPGLVVIEEYSEEDLSRSWGMFYDLLSYWKKKNKFGVNI